MVISQPMKAKGNEFFSWVGIKQPFKIKTRLASPLPLPSLTPPPRLSGPPLAPLGQLSAVPVLCGVLQKGVVGRTSRVVYRKGGSG